MPEPDSSPNFEAISESEDIAIDQVHCKDCGRPMIIRVDDPRSEFTCARCLSGLPPEWEY